MAAAQYEITGESRSAFMQIPFGEALIANLDAVAVSEERHKALSGES